MNIRLLFIFVVVMAIPCFLQAQDALLIATDDAYVRNGTGADLNFDTATAGNGLRVRAANLIDNRRKSYLKFDLSSYSGFIGTARLTIWLDRALSTHYNPLTNLYPDTALFYTVANDNWSQSTITWNNAPPADQYLFTQGFLHRSSTMADTMYSWDVTDYIRTEYAGDKKVSFLLTDPDDSTHDTDLRIFSTATFGFEPTLEIYANVLPSITVLSPNGGETWNAGESHAITWESDSVSTVKIEFSSNNGATWNVIDGAVPDSLGTYSWTVPTTASTQYRIRISDADTPSLFDISDGAFIVLGPNAPLVTTEQARSVTSTTATLIGTVTPVVTPATALFEWGTTTTYGSRITGLTIPGLATPDTITFDISKLLPATTYHFRFGATNSDGTRYGDDQTFTTASLCSGNCVTASEDAYTRAGIFADANFDTATGGNGLRIRMAPADTNKRKSYLQFDLTGYAGSIAQAKLALWVSQARNNHYLTATPYGDTATFYTVPNDSWSETSITWNNAPIAESLLFTEVFKHRTSPDTLYQWDVTPYVLSEFNGDKKVSFVIQVDDTTYGTDLRMYSRETAGKEPTLILYAPDAVRREGSTIPATLSLSQNYPNPFNPSTTIRYSLPGAADVRLDVYDLLGRQVETLVNERQNAGEYTVLFSASHLPSGMYYYRLQTGRAMLSKFMVIVK